MGQLPRQSDYFIEKSCSVKKKHPNKIVSTCSCTIFAFYTALLLYKSRNTSLVTFLFHAGTLLLAHQLLLPFLV